MTSRRLLVSAPIAALAVALAGCTAPAAIYDYPHYETWDAVVETADLVIVGAVLAEHEALSYALDRPGDEDYAVPVTVARVEVREVISGEIRPGTQIDVSVPGTRDRPAAGTRALSDIDAEELVLALAAFDGRPYVPLNPSQAVFAVGEDGALHETVASPGFPLPTRDELEG